MTCAYGASRQRHRKSSHFRTFVNSRCCSPATLSDFAPATPRFYRICQRAGSPPSNGGDACILAGSREPVKRHRARSLATLPRLSPVPAVARSHGPIYCRSHAKPCQPCQEKLQVDETIAKLSSIFFCCPASADNHWKPATCRYC